MSTQQQEVAKNKLSGKLVTICADGWTNTNNESIVCCSIQPSSSVSLVKSVSTEAKAHMSEYIADLTNNAITKAESNFECVVVGITTDNAENMAKIRKLIVEEHDIISIGCMAHQFNLLTKNLTPAQLVSRICKTAEAFKFTHSMKGLLLQTEVSTSAVILSKTQQLKCSSGTQETGTTYKLRKKAICLAVAKEKKSRK